MQVNLSEEEKENYCKLLASNLKVLRATIGCTQEDIARVSGISKERISKIENAIIPMRWVQFVSFLTIFNMNVNAKEYIIAKKILTPRLLQYLQHKDSYIFPDVMVPVNESLMRDFETDFRIENSLSLESKNNKGEKNNG